MDIKGERKRGEASECVCTANTPRRFSKTSRRAFFSCKDIILCSLNKFFMKNFFSHTGCGVVVHHRLLFSPVSG